MEKTNEQAEMTMGKAFVYYMVSLAALIGFWWLMYGFVTLGRLDAEAKWPFIPLLLFYFGIGIYLGKVVLNRLIEWHPVYNTVSNVASAKIKQIIFWPISYPLLLANLFVNKKL